MEESGAGVSQNYLCQNNKDRCDPRRSWAGTPDALWQPALVETQGEFIACWRRKIRETVVHSENERCSRQGSERDGWVATLEAPEGIPADKEAGRHLARGNAAFAPGERQISTQLPERMNCGQWHRTWFRHWFNVLYYRRYVN
jgi:hypothetical protein